MPVLRDAVYVWAVPVAFFLHNLEEVVLLPRSGLMPRWPLLGAIGAPEFRLATVFLTVAVAAIALTVTLRPVRFARVLLVGAQALISENALFHVATSLALRRYTPGLATAALLTLSFSVAFFRKALRDRVVTRGRLFLLFAAGLPLMPVVIVLSLGLARLFMR